MTDVATVDVARNGAIAVLTINNVKQRNALIRQVKAAFVPALQEAEADPEVRAIVICGAGGTFSAGGDVSIFGDMTPAKGRQTVFDQRKFLHTMIRGETPIIAAVEGFAFGAGFGVAMAADHIVADKNSKFCAAFNKIGLMPDGGLLWTLPQRVGMGRAREMLMCASVVEGKEAKRLGMIDVLAEPGSVIDIAMAKAARFAAAAPLAVGAIKSAFARFPLDLEAAFGIEVDAQPALMASADATEARRAFFAKEKPVFKGA
jgi:2-(1,2-epoxy-1,2-dihydrophenyl)acetyl-CoA isomerase